MKLSSQDGDDQGKSHGVETELLQLQRNEQQRRSVLLFARDFPSNKWAFVDLLDADGLTVCISRHIAPSDASTYKGTVIS